MKLSLDGISETKSSVTSLDVYTTSIGPCKNVYPLQIIRPINKFPLDYRHYFKQVLDDMLVNEFILTDFVGDNPKRSFVRDAPVSYTHLTLPTIYSV